MTEFRPITECFEKSDVIRAQHLLWEDFKKERTDVKGNRMYKMVFYVALSENNWGAKIGKDVDGSFGYGLRYIP